VNLLVVDGSELIRGRLAERLRSVPGVTTVATAETLRQGFGYVRSGLFGLAILDLHMPDGTSSTIVGAMKQASENIVVAIFSNHADEVNRRLCRRAGADWFFDKSLELDEVVRLAAMLARLRAGEQGATKREHPHIST
jgi:DNA-binding response OmpR family regulator